MNIMKFAAFVILAGCGNSSYNNGASTSPLSISTVQEVNCANVTEIGTVNIQSFTFSPFSETIAAGGVVKWTNNDLTTHTVTGGGPGAPNRMFMVTIPATTTACLKFTAPGSFTYFDQLFPTMTAQIVVF